MAYRLAQIALLAGLSLTPVAGRAEVRDLATMSEAGGPYEISFCARPSPEAFGFPGHAFVVFSSGDGTGQTYTALGLTVAPDQSPIDAAVSYFGVGIPGVLAEERYSHVRQTCLTLRVNKLSYDRAMAGTRPLLEQLGIASTTGPVRESYRLGANDCMSFVARVAAILAVDGLVVPERRAAELPIGYIGRLKAANAGE